MPRVFVSYSREDSRWIRHASGSAAAAAVDLPFVPWLARQLRPLGVEFWMDPELGNLPGEEFEKVICEEIDRAEFALLLISHDFVTSEFIQRVELPRIRARVERGEMQMIPILVAPITWDWNDEARWLQSRQIVPGKPTPLIEYVHNEATWKQVRMELATIVRDRVKAHSASNTGDAAGTEASPGRQRAPGPNGSGERRDSQHADGASGAEVTGIGETRSSKDDPTWSGLSLSAARTARRSLETARGHLGRILASVKRQGGQGVSALRARTAVISKGGQERLSVLLERVSARGTQGAYGGRIATVFDTLWCGLLVWFLWTSIADILAGGKFADLGAAVCLYLFFPLGTMVYLPLRSAGAARVVGLEVASGTWARPLSGLGMLLHPAFRRPIKVTLGAFLMSETILWISLTLFYTLKSSLVATLLSLLFVTAAIAFTVVQAYLGMMLALRQSTVGSRRVSSQTWSLIGFVVALPATLWGCGWLIQVSGNTFGFYVFWLLYASLLVLAASLATRLVRSMDSFVGSMVGGPTSPPISTASQDLASIRLPLVLALACVVLPLLGLARGGVPSPPARAVSPAHAVELQAGDILLVSDSHWRSSLLRAVSPSGHYSHAALVAREGSEFVVLQVTPEKDGDRVPVDEFLGSPGLQRVDVFRLAALGAGAGEAAAAWAQSVLARGVTFDRPLDHATEDALYCTELVEKSYRYTGTHLFTDDGVPLRSYPFVASSVLLPEDLADHSLLVKVGSLK